MDPKSDDEQFASQDTETYVMQGVTTVKNEQNGYESYNAAPILFEIMPAPAAASDAVPAMIPIELGRRRIQCMYPESKEKMEDYAEDSDNYDEDYDDTAKKKRKVKVSSTSSAKSRVYFSKSKKNTLRISEVIKTMRREGRTDQQIAAYFKSEYSAASSKARTIKNNATEKFWIDFYLEVSNSSDVSALTIHTERSLVEINKMEQTLNLWKISAVSCVIV
ncbi:hypothetical protein B484DRAFT_473163 [Ochromonadaceae sp. CCMP2298]|nr:hypothetical protein B484DRAFT_473163 [Ochromonadaceae sp. CCMP2298]